ncbi:uncharacterized protein [Antedon mediterranea]|uniref:uncharacterized protein n=1 Tax=Antedon mediterranea TaxID=105859 RepID=UPI003AF76379
MLKFDGLEDVDFKGKEVGGNRGHCINHEECVVVLDIQHAINSVERCTENIHPGCFGWHCSMCSYTNLRWRVKNHIKSVHWGSRVEFGDFHSLLCKCKSDIRTHWHCPLCLPTYRAFIKPGHLQMHIIRSHRPESEVKRFAFGKLVYTSVTKKTEDSQRCLFEKDAPVEESFLKENVCDAIAPKQPSSVKEVACDDCGKIMFKKNLKVHRERAHDKRPNHHLALLSTVCVDQDEGIFSVKKNEKSGHHIHVAKRTIAGKDMPMNLFCEVEKCMMSANLARHSGITSFECVHLLSVAGSEPYRQQNILNENKLQELSQLHSKETLDAAASLNKAARILSYYSRLKRIIVHYKAVDNSWHCKCPMGERSCIHKVLSKWYLLESAPELLKKTPITTTQTSKPRTNIYPPSDATKRNMVSYWLNNTSKRIPYPVPKEITQINVHSLGLDFIPTEHLLFWPTSIGYSVGFESRLGRSITQYVSLFFQSHTAAGSVLNALENTINEKLPSKVLLRGLEHFEALSDRSYKFTCVACGIHPPILITDLQKKACFSLDVSELELPDLTDESDSVDIEDFWTNVKKEKLMNGLLTENEQNPFTVKPAYTNWAPFIGRRTRSEKAINTEHRKVVRDTSQLEVDCRETSEERLLEMLHSRHIKVNQVRDLCRLCGVKPTGSKHDMVLRIRGKLPNDNVFNKVFSRVWGASGGWLSASCPHRIVYGVKFLLRAESPRDHVDLLMSLAKQPAIVVCDMPQMVSRHGNRRTNGAMFYPNDGRLAEPTEENINAAKEGTLQVHLQVLDDVYPKMNSTTVTVDSKSKLCLFDTFHQFNSKKEIEILRRVGLCPQLKGLLNSQVAEQLHRSRVRDVHFLNSMNASTHIFSFLNILDGHNTSLNKKYILNMEKMFKRQIIIDDCNKAVIGTQRAISMPTTSIETGKPTEQVNASPLSETGESDVHSEDSSSCFYIPEEYINDDVISYEVMTDDNVMFPPSCVSDVTINSNMSALNEEYDIGTDTVMITDDVDVLSDCIVNETPQTRTEDYEILSLGSETTASIDDSDTVAVNSMPTTQFHHVIDSLPESWDDDMNAYVEENLSIIDAINASRKTASDESNWVEQLKEKLVQCGLKLSTPATPGDGNCLYNALAYQANTFLKWTGVTHIDLRNSIAEFLEAHKTQWQEKVTQDILDMNLTWDQFIRNVKTPGVWGDQIVLTAAAWMLRCNIKLISATLTREICPPSKTNLPTIHLGYVTGLHYTSIEPIGQHNLRACPPKKRFSDNWVCGTTISSCTQKKSTRNHSKITEDYILSKFEITRKRILEIMQGNVTCAK